MHWSSRINHKHTIFCGFWRLALAPLCLQKKKWLYHRLWACIFLFTSHAALPAQSSCRKVSLGVLSSNLDAQGFRTWVSLFWIIPRDGPFVSQVRISYLVRPENLMVCRAEAFPLTCPAFRRIDFFGSEFWDTQLWNSLCFRIATTPWVLSFFDLFLGFSSPSACRNRQLLP